MNYPPPQPQPQLQPVKKGMSGCMIGLLVLGGILLLGGLTIGFVVYRAVSSPEGQKAIGIMGDGIKLAADSTSAPGTTELRAIGCTQAAVIDTEKFAQLAKDIDPDAGAKVAAEQKAVKAMVSCSVPNASSGPSCDDVAKTYLKVVKPTGNVMVTVGAQNANKCTAEYTPAGTKIEPKPGAR